MISAKDILDSSGKYPDREQSPECTDSVRKNAEILATKVSNLLAELGYKTSVSSGFRTSAANTKAGGAKRSAHMRGQAVDLLDPSGSLGKVLMNRQDLLHKHDLYMEHPEHTRGWVHLDTVPRKYRVFNP